MYDCYGRETNSDIELKLPNSKIKRVELTNLMEKTIKELDVNNERIKLKFNPYEIHTVKINWN